MRTASEYTKDFQQMLEKQAKELLLRKENFLKELPETTNPEAKKWREGFLIDYRLKFSGIACDNCNTELVNYGETLLSNPPKIKHFCLGCGEVYLLVF